MAEHHALGCPVEPEVADVGQVGVHWLPAQRRDRACGEVVDRGHVHHRAQHAAELRLERGPMLLVRDQAGHGAVPGDDPGPRRRPGSIGNVRRPAFITPYRAATVPTDLGANNATRPPRRTPAPAKAAATRSDSSSSSR